MYTKANEAENELDERRKIKLQEKCNDAKAAAQLLAEKCDSVYSLIQSRLPESKRKPRPAMHPPPHLAAVAPPSEVPSRSASNKKKKDQSPATTGKRGRPKKDKVDAVARPGNSKKNQAAPSSAASQVTTSKKKRAIEKERAPSPSSSEDTSPIAKRQKKQSSKSMTPPTKSTSDGEIPYMNRRIAKDFDGEIYFGFVTGFVPSSTNAEAIDLWAITYDDGDAEDLEEDELMHGFLLYRKHKSGDEVGKTSAKRNQDKKKMKSGGSDKKSSRRK